MFQAFREVEIAVRCAGTFQADLVGKELMREALDPLIPGAIGLYKNPQSHRNVPTDAVDAAEVIVFASHLLRIIEQLAPA